MNIKIIHGITILLSYKVFDLIIEHEDNTGDYDYQVVKYYKNIEKHVTGIQCFQDFLNKFPEIETGF